MPTKLRLPDGSFTTATNMAETPVNVVSATIPTAAGATDVYITAPVTGRLTAAQITPLVALAASNTNYITFTVTNLGSLGTDTTAMLAVHDLNTTKLTGGAGLSINTKRDLVVHGTAANIEVEKGDAIRITATGTGTLANTVTVPRYMLTFTRTV